MCVCKQTFYCEQTIARMSTVDNIMYSAYIIHGIIVYVYN